MVNRLLIVQNMLGETAKRAVKSLFYISREDAGGKFLEFQVIGDAIAALALPGTWLISAVAAGLVGIYITFHQT